jgi:hypothetical protein
VINNLVFGLTVVGVSDIVGWLLLVLPHLDDDGGDGLLLAAVAPEASSADNSSSAIPLGVICQRCRRIDRQLEFLLSVL